MAKGTVLRGRELQGPQRFSVDVVVVGSGSSGAVAAAEFARAGQSVLVVEEGPWIRAIDHGRMRPSQSLRTAWREGGMSAAFGIGKTPLINVTMGRAVGGSSILTGAVCFRTPGFVHRVWTEERGLKRVSEASMVPWFEEVERIANVEEVPVSMQSRSTSLWGEGARKMGGDIRPNRRNTKGCTGCSQCNFSCPEGAKMSVDQTFLPDALNHGATILSDCLVERITTKGGRAAGIEGRLLNRGTGKPGDKVVVEARRVVLAAGAAHTPLLLMRSGVGRRSRQVGRNMTLHPSFRMIARFDDKVEGWKGAMQSAHSDSWEHEGLTLMSVFVPPAVVLSAVPGFGHGFADRADDLPNLAMFGGMIHDEGGGRILRGPGREPLMLYKMSALDRSRLPNLIRVLGNAYLEAGAKELFLPVLGHPSVTADEFRRLDLDRISPSRMECSSQHPLGTTRMGSEPTNSVVNDEGKVWDLDELYVVDGGIIPTSLGVNPQLTIMAMALRLARGIAERPLPAA